MVYELEIRNMVLALRESILLYGFVFVKMI